MLQHVLDDEAQIMYNFKESWSDNDPRVIEYNTTVKTVRKRIIDLFKEFKKNNNSKFCDTMSALYGQIQNMKAAGVYDYYCQVTRESRRK